MQRFYLDCEFDGHNGPLLSMALVPEEGASIHIQIMTQPKDPWVIANVMPLMEHHEAETMALVPSNSVGEELRAYLGSCEHPVIIADSPVDISRFCAAISTDPSGAWASTDYPQMTFEVHNVDCYPTTLPSAVQHNAWWDAMALCRKLSELGK